MYETYRCCYGRLLFLFFSIFCFCVCVWWVWLPEGVRIGQSGEQKSGVIVSQSNNSCTRPTDVVMVVFFFLFFYSIFCVCVCGEYGWLPEGVRIGQREWGKEVGSNCVLNDNSCMRPTDVVVVFVFFFFSIFVCVCVCVVRGWWEVMVTRRCQNRPKWVRKRSQE